jgi:hypothetical protein
MANNSTVSLNVVDLDRDALIADLRDFMRSQPVFKDYDFDGSTLSVLIRLLAHNTHKSSFLTNMLFAEAYLDSAQMRSSVFSHAKDLNYLPRSIRSSVATLRVTFPASGEHQPYVVPKGSSFSTLIKNTSFVFTVPETITVSSPDGNYSFETDVYEGSYQKDVYVFRTSEDEALPRFRISDRNADVSSLSVVVLEDGQTVGTKYLQRNSLLDVTQDDPVFFVQASSQGFYEVLFGDGIIGRVPAEGSTVILDYRTTSGDLANGARVFTPNFDPTSPWGEATSAPVVETITPSAGGSPPESTESIRYYAPRWYQARESAIVDKDYGTLLRTEFPEITAVSAFGGETLDPPLYGKIGVCVAISGFDRLPDSRLEAYREFLTRRSALGMRPVFFDPEYTRIRIRTKVRYDVGVTTLSPSRIESLVRSAVQDYATRELDDFNSTLRFSRLSGEIDDSDASVVSNETEVTILKTIAPVPGSALTTSVAFQIPIRDTLPPVSYPHPSTDDCRVRSGPFVYRGVNARIEDDGSGSLRVVQDRAGKTTSMAVVGTVDYDSGTLSIENLVVDSYDGDEIEVEILPRDVDVSAQKTTILRINPEDVDVSVEGIRT